MAAEWPLYSQRLFIISEMKVLGTAGAAIGVLVYVILISLPGIGIAYLGWRSSRKLRPVSAQTFFRAGLIATAITPSFWGHAGFLPAIFLAYVLHGRDKLAGIVPILIVWLVAIPVIGVRVKERGAS
jgi:hypothetical protein